MNFFINQNLTALCRTKRKIPTNWCNWDFESYASQWVSLYLIFDLYSSLHGDDDEDRIPEELLLKYTKAEEEEDFPVEKNVEEKNAAAGAASTGEVNSSASPSASVKESRPDSIRRAETPDKLPPEVISLFNWFFSWHSLCESSNHCVSENLHL